MKDFEIKTKDKETNTFENVEYTGIYDIDKSFTVESEKAHILDESPNVVYMNTMRVTLYMSDGRIVVNHFSGGERVGPLDVFTEVSSGNAQMYDSADYYWVGQHPILNK